MAARVFKLPDIDDLTKEQDAIIDLPLEGQHLVVGGPGTGKSVVALMRARRLAREQQPYVCLAYNKTLLKSNEQLFGEGLQSKQWESWFAKTYSSLIGNKVPRLEPKKGTYPPIDWDKVSNHIVTHTAQDADSDTDIDKSDDETIATAHDTLIIDEGQDMPPSFYSSLVELGFENFFVVADQNQQINSGCSNIKELRAVMVLEPEEVFELTINWRNSYEIAVFSRHFFTDEATPAPNLPDPNTRATGNLPILYSYNFSNFATVIERILIQAKDYDHKLIGIICPNNVVLEAYVNQLTEQKNTNADYQGILIGYYKNGQVVNIDFGQGGIFVVNAHSCKGLEFDTVFLADIDDHYAPSNTDVLKKRFYVMASRAREKLFLLRKNSSNTTTVDEILPTDDAVITRY
ncbi:MULTISPECIES: 3'-5' exonuclease [unclassified Psychrobacter]|uniref:3'-5' exonuclease n=1 Tax=unclassified Psychrobacter TaxID=196806 RepID=UPI003F9D7135